MSSPSINFTMTMHKDLKKRLESYSTATGVPIGEVLRRLSDEFLAGRVKTNALPAVKP